VLPGFADVGADRALGLGADRDGQLDQAVGALVERVALPDGPGQVALRLGNLRKRSRNCW
jgi:hypothetical protein